VMKNKITRKSILPEQGQPKNVNKF